ncbi:hypothetical protein ACROYT_G006040 [Oculina patagonica]
MSTGVRQGCLQSPIIFIMVVDWIMREVEDQDKYPPRFQGTPKLQYNAEVGEDKRLRCVVTGQPPPTITWSKDGKPLQLSERVRNLSSNKTIKIKQVRLGDQGNYTCIAENAFGKLNLTLTLIVRQGISASISTSQLTSTTQVPPTQVQAQGAPTFSDPSMLKRAFRAWPASHSIRLKCLATGAPPLKYTWLKNGEKMRKRRMDPYLNTSIWYLALKNLVPDDSGKYTCIVSNPYGSINHTYTLQVVAKPRSRPILEKGLPKNTTVQIGDNATMTCIVLVSGTLPDFRWLKWEKSVTSMPKLGDDLENGLYRLIDPHYYKFIQVEGNYGAELRITNVTEEDFGLYTCFVSNHIGNDYNSAFLSEYVKPTAPVRVTTPTVGKITEENTRNASIEGFQGRKEPQPKAARIHVMLFVAIPLCGVLIITATLVWYFWQKRKIMERAPPEPLMMDTIERSGPERKPRNEYVFLPQF